MNEQKTIDDYYIELEHSLRIANGRLGITPSMSMHKTIDYEGALEKVKKAQEILEIILSLEGNTINDQ